MSRHEQLAARDARLAGKLGIKRGAPQKDAPSGTAATSRIKVGLILLVLLACLLTAFLLFI